MLITRAEIAGFASMDDLTALSLRHDSISDGSCALLGFQRTKQIAHKAKRAWEKGDSAPLLQEVKDRKDQIIQGAMLEIYQEYLPLKQVLAKAKIKTVCDIGCGQGINNIFLAADYDPSFTLVDIEKTDDQYHLWADSGSGYASLEAARNLLIENGVSADSIETLNPVSQDRDINLETFDLVISLYSCGFHYPVDDYADLLVNTVNKGGAVCLDLRRKYLKKGGDGLARLMAAAPMETVYEDNKSIRTLFRKQKRTKKA